MNFIFEKVEESNTAQPKPGSFLMDTRCLTCGFVAASVVCHICGNDKAVLTKVKALDEQYKATHAAA